MNFINKNILLCLALAIPFAHAGQTNHRPWYTRLFGGYSAAVVSTAAVTSLGWWYFGVKPLKKQNKQIKQDIESNTLLKDMHEIALLQRDLIIKLDTQLVLSRNIHATYIDNKKMQTELLFKERKNQKIDLSIDKFAIEQSEIKLKNYDLEQEKNNEAIFKIRAKLREKLDQNLTISFWEKLPETPL